MANNDSLLNRGVAGQLELRRKNQKMEQRALAEVSGVPLVTVQRILSAKTEMKMSTFAMLCSALKTTPSEILRRAFATEGEAEIVADLRRRFGVEVSEGGAKVTDIASRQAAAEKLTTEGVEKIRAEGRAAASEDDDATRDEPDGP